MSFARFFVDRPIFAVVLSFLAMIAGAVALTHLPLSEYPAVSPPTVVVRAAYPGASPEVIAQTVAAPLEQELQGVEGMTYMSSQSTTDGRMSLTLTFDQGVDPDRAQVQVQNRVSRTLPRLPEEVQRLGVVSEKTSPDLLMVVHLVSPNATHDPLFLSDFATRRVRDELARLPGVGSVVVWGAGDYSMRVWLDPDRLAARGITANEVVAAIRQQNVQVAAGALGQQPDGTSAFEIPLGTRGRFSDEDEFRDVVVRVDEAGRLTRLGDVARVELGANGYSLRSLLDGEPAVAMQILLTPGANALDVASSVRARMDELAVGFPADVAHRIVYDPTIFVRASIDNVLATLFEAVLLVVLVVLVFLQSWRASVIPLVAVPISLLGTAAVMYLADFSLNTLSLFGLVLSIGIVVDDAIVVVENVERHLATGASPKEAARRAMKEVTGPIVAITSVLAAVFLPSTFLDGLTGQFYRQFAVTIAISTVLSAFVSLTLSPALAGVMLRGHDVGRTRRGWIARFFTARFFEPFNRFFERTSNGYVTWVRRLVRVSAIASVVYVGLLALTAAGFREVPRGFVPMQDKHYLVGIVQLPPASSLDRTDDVMRRVSRMALEEPGVESVVAFPGLSIQGFVNAPNAGVFFTVLDPFEDRASPELSANAIAGRLQARVASVEEGFVGVFPPPPVPGLGAMGGFKLQLQDRGDLGPEALHAATHALIARASTEPSVSGLMTSFEVNAPQVRLDVDRERAMAQGVSLPDVFDALQIHLGSLYVNDFFRDGRNYQVRVQADAAFRREEDDLARLRVRSRTGAMVPLGSLVSSRPDFGPDRVMRYNGHPSADVTGGPGPGFTTSQAVATMERLAAEVLPEGVELEWTEITLQERRAGQSEWLLFPLALLLAYLILAAQYDSWTLPLAVLFSVPLALLGSVTGILWVGGANDIFTQIGFVVLVGLSAKNAILIVEFARSLEHEGHDPLAAALEACRLRLRPILMTSLAFIMGVVPLVIATGAGAEMRQSMGISVLSGMIGGTALGLLFTPLFYVLIRRASLWLASLRAPKTAHAAVVAALLGLALVAPDRAHALPPLEHFLEAGRTHALDQRIAEHAVEVGEARRVEARAELLPSVSAIGTYARNQYRIALEADAPARDAVFQAENQLSATFLLDVPLFDLAAWRRVATARAGADAARLDAEATRLEVERRVAAAYYQLLASDALAASARLAEDVAREHLRVVEARVAAGAAPAVERERALADVAQRVEIVAEIDLARRAARRELRTLTGIDVPEDEAVDATTLPDDVAPGVLDELLAGLVALPSVRAARAHAETSRSAVRAARASYAPVVAAQGSERIVNAPGFGPSRQWQIALVARARFDFVTPARVRRTEAETELARLHEEDVRTRARTAIEDAFDRATASRARATAAEARVAAARRTAEEALRRYEVGRAAHLEVIDANREAFSASIELVRARAETAYAVALLRILSGATLEHGRSS